MKATTTLQVPRTMVLDIKLQITVDEADALLRELPANFNWPVSHFREVIRRSLEAARASHQAEHDTTPT